MQNYSQDLIIPTDPAGYLLYTEDWNELVANQLAEIDGVGPLTEDHWTIIQSLRRHYFEVGGVPSLRHICVENHLDPHCITTLFKDHGREVWRLAGLPNPGDEATAYL
ncbi:MAG: TusE/DsrC/DsvC family sulfur relay protein [Gammaproteobacteria bacterium]|nr:TusE/DsrC/DsvC family sulfur relay protein [Gammaproteobacteria bacterium]